MKRISDVSLCRTIRTDHRWALLWESTTQLDGYSRHLIADNTVVRVFRSRAEARAYAKEKFGYIAKRPDLRKEPHCWRVPKPVRVMVQFVLAA